MHPYILHYRGYSEAYVTMVTTILRVGVVYLCGRSTINGPLAKIQFTMHAQKEQSYPDFAAVKELVEQHVDSYRCSKVSLVQAFRIRRPLLELQALLDKMYLNHAHGSA